MVDFSYRDIEPWQTAAKLIAEFGEDAVNEAGYRCEDLASAGRTDDARNMLSVLCAVQALGPSRDEKSQVH